jgi:hypothetical protein
LSIVAHLGVSSPSFQIENLRSALDISALSRYRIRKHLSAFSGTFLAESRISSVDTNIHSTSLLGLLHLCVNKVENACSEYFDSYVFAPKIPTLEKALSESRYCAVSSSSVDAACFFKGEYGSYLWDYELPAYSRRAGQNNGYYLLAKESPNMVHAVHAAIRTISKSQQLESDKISALLSEISHRGMPTLRRLTGGGSTSLGEIGMLVALRLLQSEFQKDADYPALCPVYLDQDTINLLIPVDPFKNHFIDLQTAINQRPGERPDMLILSIGLFNGKPTRVKITPIEVKARGGLLSQIDREDALTQASSFSQFLVAAHNRASTIPIWDVAWKNLIVSLLDYGFRVYGQLDRFLKLPAWTDMHSAVIHGIAGGNTQIEIDSQGRLIVIEDTESSRPCDIDQDGFRETIVLSHKDAFSLLSVNNPQLLVGIREMLGDWGIKPESLSVDARIFKAAEESLSIDLSPKVCKQTSVEELNSLQTNIGTPEIEKNPRNDKLTSIESDNLVNDVGIKFVVGKAIDAFQEKELYYYPSNTSLNQLNIGIAGDLGTGKTQLTQMLLSQLRSYNESNRGIAPKVLIFDYKKDYSKPEFVKATGATVISPFSIPLNIFDTRDSSGPQNHQLERVKLFCDTLDKIYSGIGPKQREQIKLAVKDAYAKTEVEGRLSPTIYDVFTEYKNNISSPRDIDTPYSIMSDIVDNGYFVSDSKKVQRFSEFLNGIVVVDLSAVGQDDRTKNMLVAIILNLFYEHMLRIEKKPFIGTDPQLRFVDTMLLVDEAVNIMSYEFDVLKKILLQGREFGVGVILASQYLKHFKTSHENYMDPLLTWFIHKVPNITIRELEGIGLPRVDSSIIERIKRFECHQCLYKTYDVEGELMRGIPFYELKKT